MFIDSNRKYIIFFFCIFTNIVLAQKSAKDLLRDANSYYNLEKYDNALENYFELQKKTPVNLDIQTRMAVCYYQVGNIDESLRYLNYVISQDKKPDPIVPLCMARCLHENLDFKEAIRWYKKYLAAASKKAKEYAGVKDDIKRCAKGLKIKNLSSENFIQNLGEGVNTVGDEFAPILSPNNDEKIYFSSARGSSLGGLRNEEGIRDDKAGFYSSDIFSAQVENGEWGGVRPLSYLLNGPRHDVALDFSSDGQQMYYYRGYNLFSGDIYVDTFKTFEERTLNTSPFRSPMNVEDGDGTPFFVNDTFLLFASRRSGGQGGADLYYSLFQNGSWQTPNNFGADVNSAYDEICPFLAADGRTLYFSSNNLQSMGGFDIFKTTYVDDSLRWTMPENLALPINSPSDDAFFRLNSDGTKAFFSSHRKGGFGQRDIYSAFFRKGLEEQTTASVPDLFFKVPAIQAAKKPIVEDKPKVEPTIIYTVSQISYDKENEILSAKNQKTLNALLAILKKNADTRVRLVSHTETNAGTSLDAFLSIKRNEKVAEYLVKEGIASDKIDLLGCGANYSVALNNIEGEASVAGQRFNRRIEIFFTKEDKSLKINMESPEVPDYLQSGEFFRFKNIDKGLSYRVRIASLKQMYNGDIVERYPDLMIEKNAGESTYQYSLGLFPTFEQAERLRKDLELQGIPSAQVIPYVAGWRLQNDDDAKKNITQYPDLQKFINRKK